MDLKPTRFLNRETAGIAEFISRGLDALGCLIASLIITLWLPIQSSMFRDWGLLVLIFVLINSLSFQQADLYRSWRGRPFSDQFGRLILAWLFSGLVISGVWAIFSMSEIIPGAWLVYWLLLAVLIISIQRISLHASLRFFRKQGINRKLILIYGAGNLGKSIANQVEKSTESGFQIHGFIDDNPDLLNQVLISAPVLGGLDKLDQILENNAIDEIWVALPLAGTPKVTQVLEIADKYMRSVRLFPDIYGLTLLNHSVSELLGFPIIDLNVDRMEGINRFLKETEDRALGLLFFLIALPVIGLIAAIIKTTSDGPILFKQRRTGWDGKPFTIYKFRTMRLHQEPTGQLTQAQRNDARLTPVGRWLRRTSLDELPQLFNVLQGRMSLVGPRPHAVEHDNIYEKQIEGYMRRNRVKPGITGWAQINDLRGEIEHLDDMIRRVKHDLYYIEHWSVWFDLRIILATILKIFFSKKAW